MSDPTCTLEAAQNAEKAAKHLGEVALRLQNQANMLAWAAVNSKADIPAITGSFKRILNRAQHALTAVNDADLFL